MENTSALPADGTAERIVRHFQAEGFAGISEALIIRIACKKSDRMEIEAAFHLAADQDKIPPVREHFDIRLCGHFSDFRSLAAATAAIQSDFTVNLRRALPALFFDPAPVVAEDGGFDHHHAGQGGRAELHQKTLSRSTCIRYWP